jgi:UDP-3-O-[3-hydroxymyristoyl] glucosamine N-acyltransferase
MALTLAQIASRLGGRVAGDPQVLIRQVAALEHAAEGDISFFARSRYRKQLEGTRASAVIVGEDSESLTAKPRIVCKNPYAYFARVAQLFHPRAHCVAGIDPAARVAHGASVAASARLESGAVVDEGARIGERAWIGAGSYVGPGASIGPDSRLHPSVVVYAQCRIGARAIVHSGVVIGADGFGFAPDAGEWIKIPQIGRVVIGDDVEIGANTTIDRGAMSDTVIGDGVKIDNQVQIGHGVRVGAHTVIAGCAGIAGSVVIGKGCIIAGAAMLQEQITLCDGAQISTGTLVTHSITKPGVYTGFYPVDEHEEWRRNAVHVRRLAELSRRVQALEKLLAQKEAGHG